MESHPATTLEVLTPSCPCLALQEEIQSDSALLPPPEHTTASAAEGGGWQAIASGATSKNETGRATCPKVSPKPSISKVILRAAADKGPRHLVSLAALKSAVATVGYDVSRNAWRFKRALKKLVDQGMLQQVTGRGALGSFRLGKKQASKPKLKAKSPSQSQRRRAQRRGGQCRPGQHRSL
ncbi:spermatid-specific linker histone H1-like protein [Heterocephalus glaber]|uniref:Histone H1.9 n=1 Tax=Heterocephalus glaber TaxID=10181 RepID=A0AAX6PTG7_HETGA|nr:spermatid-specific linker histone H1-like protein [Heterocephalus glaber]